MTIAFLNEGEKLVPTADDPNASDNGGGVRADAFGRLVALCSSGGGCRFPSSLGGGKA
jgi:hypothetical protein